MPALAGIAARMDRPVQWSTQFEFVIKVRAAKDT
jgi:hypothetical protein